jgi:protoporphyrinogen oxidase
MKRIGVIGGGISGLSIAQMLSGKHEVTVFESTSRPGGLIKCDIVNGSLFHCTGGHVFNSKREDVLDWFWSKFDRDAEFVKTRRNASVYMAEEKVVPYPIENYVYHLSERIQKSFINDLVSITTMAPSEPTNFEEFLIGRFGQTLYDLYFKPYNYKIWRKDLKQVPLSWLEGKLPMPTIQEILYNNINHKDEDSFVHSSFYYAKQGGSQFIVDRLSQGLDIRCDSCIQFIEKAGAEWIIEEERFELIVFCGNVKQVPSLISKQVNLDCFAEEIRNLEYHGTTTVFCEIDNNPYSWVYMPSSEHESHRIICTGNFSLLNNADGKFTGTIEFTNKVSESDILDNLSRIPFNPKYITHHYAEYTYPIQNLTTKTMINNLKCELELNNIYLLGRFAEWEYYNMDAVIGSALSLADRINLQK